MNEQIRKVRIWAEQGIRLYENQIKEDKDSGVEKSEWNEGCLDTLQRTIAFIDSITNEPVADDLEEAARLYAIPHYMKDIDVNHIEEYPYDTGLEAAFIAGAKWQAEKDKDTIELAEDHAYLAGAVNEKEQMMKQAVEAYVCAAYPAAQGNVIEYSVKYPKDKYPYKFGDKVRILVLPKED